LPPLGPLVGPGVQRAPEIRVRCGRDAVETPPVPLPIIEGTAQTVAAVLPQIGDLVVERRSFLLERVTLRDRLHLQVTPRPRMSGAAHHRVLVALPHLPLDPRRPRHVVVEAHWTASTRDLACSASRNAMYASHASRQRLPAAFACSIRSRNWPIRSSSSSSAAK